MEINISFSKKELDKAQEVVEVVEDEFEVSEEHRINVYDMYGQKSRALEFYKNKDSIVIALDDDFVCYLLDQGTKIFNILVKPFKAVVDLVKLMMPTIKAELDPYSPEDDECLGGFEEDLEKECEKRKENDSWEV